MKVDEIYDLMKTVKSIIKTPHKEDTAMSIRSYMTSDSSFSSVYSCTDCPDFRQTPERNFCSRLNKDVAGEEIPSWCPLGEIEDMMTSRPKLGG